MSSRSHPLAIPDVNVLVALTNATHVFHVESHRWLSKTQRYATTPVTEIGLVRMLLNPAVVGQTVTSQQALEILIRVRADGRAEFIPDDSTLARPQVDVIGLGGHKQVTDWHLLNLAATHDAQLVTFDKRIARATLPLDSERILTLGA